MAPKSSYDVIFPFGKHKGKSLGFIYDSDPNYINWLATNDKMPGDWPIACQRLLSNLDIDDLNLPKSTYELKNIDVEMWVGKKNTIHVSFAYDKELLERFKFEIDGRKWNADDKCWVVPAPAIVKMVDLFGGTSNIRADAEVKKMYREEVQRRKHLDTIRIKEDTDIQINTKLQLYPYQKVAVEFIERAGGRAMVADQMGLGKMQSLDSKILTPNGWTTMGELHIGDFVVGVDGQAVKITNIFDHKQVELFKVEFSDGSSTICGDDHLWMVNTAERKFRGAPARVLPLKDIRIKLRANNGNALHYIPIVAPVEFNTNNASLPIHPYIMGILLGAGSFRGKNLRVTTADPEIINTLTYFIEDELIQQKSKIDFRFRGIHTRDHIKSLGLMNKLSDEKFIPDIYKFASIEDRILLLQGLMDTDGWCDKEKRNGTHIGFCTTSEQLQKDFVELVQSLGGTCRISNKKPWYYSKTRTKIYGKKAWSMTLALSNNIIPFKLERKRNKYKPGIKYQPTRSIVSVTFDRIDDARCIEVDSPDHLYVTDDYIVTHNTATAIGYAHYKSLKTLVICPKSVVVGWSREIERFTGKKATMWGTDQKLGRIDAQYHIINYDIVDRRIDELRAAGFDLLVCDEATYIKNRNTKRAKSILGDYKHRKQYPGLKTKHVIFLTGTPVLNKPIEAFVLLNFLDNTRFNNFFQFTQKYGGWKGDQPRNLDDLHERTKDLVIRRLKKDILTELPPKQRNDLFVELSPTEMKEYNDLLNKLFRKWRSLGKPTIAEMPKIQNYLIDKKIPRLIEVVDELLSQDRGVLIYSCYVDPLKRLAAHYGDKSALIHGQLTTTERQISIDNLKMGNAKVGLFSIGAGAMGIDGLQHSIDTVIFCDRWWIPSIHEQAEDRLFRTGQTKQVSAYYMTCEGTIDEYMGTLLREKQEMIDKLVDGKILNFSPDKSFFREFVRMLKTNYLDSLEDLDMTLVVDAADLL